MTNMLYIVAVILITFWAVGFFAYGAGSPIHILPGIACISIFFKVSQGKGIYKRSSF